MVEKPRFGEKFSSFVMSFKTIIHVIPRDQETNKQSPIYYNKPL